MGKYEISEEEKVKRGMSKDKEVPLTKEGFVITGSCDWGVTSDDLEFNVRHMTVENYRSIIQDALSPYYSRCGMEKDHCSYCDMWCCNCHICPTGYWSTEVLGLEDTVCRNLIMYRELSDWSKAGLMAASHEMHVHLMQEDNMEAYRNHAIRFIRTNVLKSLTLEELELEEVRDVIAELGDKIVTMDLAEFKKVVQKTKERIEEFREWLNPSG